MLSLIAQTRNPAFHPEVEIDKMAAKIDASPMPDGLQNVRDVLQKAVRALQL